MAELVDISLSAIKTESEMEIDTVEDALEHAADYAVEDAADDTTKQYEFEQIFIKVENDIVEENAEQEDIFSKEEDQDYPCIPGCAESEFVKETSKNNQLNFIDNLPLIHMKEEPAITNPVLCPRSDLVGNMRSRFLEILNNKSNNFLNTTENKSPEDPISQHVDDPAYILPDDNICGEVEECSVYGTSHNQLFSNVSIPVAEERPSGDLVSAGIEMVNGEMLNKTVLQEGKSEKANCRRQQQRTREETEVISQEEFVNEDDQANQQRCENKRHRRRRPKRKMLNEKYRARCQKQRRAAETPEQRRIRLERARLYRVRKYASDKLERQRAMLDLLSCEKSIE